MPTATPPHPLDSALLDDEDFCTLLGSLARSRSSTITSNPPESIDDTRNIEIEDDEALRRRMLKKVYQRDRKNIVSI